MLINVGLMLIAQHWLVIAMGAVAVVLNYIIALGADRAGIEKFGDAYRRYMQKVPRMNFLLGLMRLLRRSKGE
jgi:protein-S-isoprenylcysteine O-methyltransferase Ste14